MSIIDHLEGSRGRVQLWDDGPGQADCLLVFDGGGIYRGMLRVGDTCLQFTEASAAAPRSTRAWRDATELWNAFPKWLRAEATDKLHLHAIF